MMMMDDGALDDLRGRLNGRVFLPTDAGYDDAREIFNVMHDRRPAVVARCASTEDVVACVDVARRNGVLVAVRSGGHSVAGNSTCEGGMVIDLAGLGRIDVDPQARTARAGGGVLWGDFDAATQAHGLHTPGGRVTTTGVGGFTTGGGYGWTSSKYGLTSDNLISAEVVLADGSVVRASAEENAELFWGIRGGGGNFGVVTEFEFGLHELGPIVLAGLALWPIDRAREVMSAWRDIVDEAPDELSTGCVILTAPPEEFVPDHLKGQAAVGMAVMYVGDPEAGRHVVQPLKDLAPDVDLIQPMPYTAFQAMLDPSLPPGMRSYWRGEYMSSLGNEAISTFTANAPHVRAAGVPFSQMIIFRIGQAIQAVPDEASAFSNREAKYMLHPISVWADPADDEHVIAVNRTFCEAMRPFTTGAPYLNWTGEDRVREAFGDAKYARLVALKDRYDRDNLFRLNQNIRPSAQTGEPVLA
jgi:FAD/FMN-containing dehydrogenase